MNGAEVLFPEPTATEVRSLILRSAGRCACAEGATCRLLAMLAQADARNRCKCAEKSA